MDSLFLSEKVRVFAHRGDSMYFPENTMPAFKSAADLGVDCIETDIHLTKDGVCVIWHDDTLERTGGKPDRICALTLEDLKKVDAGYMFSPDGGKTFPFRGRGISVITLDELLEELPEMKFNIDLKDRSRKLTEEFARVIKRHKAENRVLGASFHLENLLGIRKLIPRMTTSFAPEEAKTVVLLGKTGLLRFRKNFPAEAFQVPEYSGRLKVVSRRIVSALHRKGIAVHVWTVNSRRDMERLFSLGVDGIFTDNPRLLINTVREMKL